MEVGKSISKAVAEHLIGDLDSAMLHACMAIDGTAAKVYPGKGVGARFRTLLRANYASILEPMMPGVNLKTLFPIQGISNPGSWPDFVDVIYVIHRCNQGHGQPLPAGYELIPDTRLQPPRTTMKPTLNLDGTWAVQLSDRCIYGMLAVALLSPANVGQTLDGGYYLIYKSITGETCVQLDNNWWGRADDFAAIAEKDEERNSIMLDFRNYMPAPTVTAVRQNRTRSRSRRRPRGKA